MEEQSSDAEPDLWIWICIIKVGSRSVWRDRNPDKGHTRNPRMTRRTGGLRRRTRSTTKSSRRTWRRMTTGKNEEEDDEDRTKRNTVVGERGRGGRRKDLGGG